MIARAALVLASLLAAAPAFANPYAVSEVPRMIPARDARKLIDAGIRVTDDLLRQAATPDARRQLARKTGLRGARIDQLVRYADFLRLQNVGPEFVMLLDAAGVKSVSDLANRSAPDLTKKIEAANRARHLTDPAPKPALVQDWISQAAKLPAVISPG